MFDGVLPVAKPKCLHCGARMAYTSRGLCNRCFGVRRVRDLYPLPDEPPKFVACRHCGKEKANRPRGLGWNCYYTPGVKELYPSTSRYARAGAGNYTGTPPPPATATDAAPGSEEKIAVMAERLRRKEALHHPRDRKADRSKYSAVVFGTVHYRAGSRGDEIGFVRGTGGAA